MPLVDVSLGSDSYSDLDVPDDCTVGLWKKLLGQGFLGDKILYSTKLTCHEAERGKQLEDGAPLPTPPDKMYIEGPGSVVKMLELALKKKLGPPAARANNHHTPVQRRPALGPKDLGPGANSWAAAKAAMPRPPPLRPPQAAAQQATGGRRAHALREGGEDERMRYCRAGLQGMRPHMEDRTIAVLKLEGHAHVGLFGVFDGHGGHEVAELAVELLPRLLAAELTTCAGDPEEALRRSFRALDEACLRDRHGIAGSHPFDRVGSTAVVLLVLREAGRTRLLCSNCGDSRAVLSRRGRALDLSVDQKPQNPEERARIEAAGGRVELFGPCFRIDAGLNLSRALGDFAYKANSAKSAKEQKVVAEPEIQEVLLEEGDDFVAMGSDGIFDVLSSQELVQQLRDAKQRGTQLQSALETTLMRCLPGGDNVSLCVVEFQRPS